MCWKPLFALAILEVCERIELRFVHLREPQSAMLYWLANVMPGKASFLYWQCLGFVDLFSTLFKRLLRGSYERSGREA